jgi:hypothetical protein
MTFPNVVAKEITFIKNEVIASLFTKKFIRQSKIPAPLHLYDYQITLNFLPLSPSHTHFLAILIFFIAVEKNLHLPPKKGVVMMSTFSLPPLFSATCDVDIKYCAKFSIYFYLSPERDARLQSHFVYAHVYLISFMEK